MFYILDEADLFEPEPVRGQLEIPFDVEDTHKIYGFSTPPEVDLGTRYGVKVIRWAVDL